MRYAGGDTKASASQGMVGDGKVAEPENRSSTTECTEKELGGLSVSGENAAIPEAPCQILDCSYLALSPGISFAVAGRRLYRQSKWNDPRSNPSDGISFGRHRRVAAFDRQLPTQISVAWTQSRLEWRNAITEVRCYRVGVLPFLASRQEQESNICLIGQRFTAVRHDQSA